MSATCLITVCRLSIGTYGVQFAADISGGTAQTTQILLGRMLIVLDDERVSGRFDTSPQRAQLEYCRQNGHNCACVEQGGAGRIVSPNNISHNLSVPNITFRPSACATSTPIVIMNCGKLPTAPRKCAGLISDKYSGARPDAKPVQIS
jgi:hypothetical protein